MIPKGHWSVAAAICIHFKTHIAYTKTRNEVSKKTLYLHVYVQIYTQLPFIAHSHLMTYSMPCITSLQQHFVNYRFHRNKYSSVVLPVIGSAHYRWVSVLLRQAQKPSYIIYLCMLAGVCFRCVILCYKGTLGCNHMISDVYVITNYTTIGLMGLSTAFGWDRSRPSMKRVIWADERDGGTDWGV